MILRRHILKLLGAAPFVAPRVLHTTETTVGGNVGHQLTQGMGSGGLVDAASERGPSTAPINKREAERIQKMMVQWVRTRPGYLEELHEAVRRETTVTYIDPDLMAMKSLSMAARIVYMRERLIERRVRAQLTDEDASIWSITEKWMKRAREFVGIKE